MNSQSKNNEKPKTPPQESVLTREYVDLSPLPQPLSMPTNMPLDKGIERLVRILRYNGRAN
jgi:hypothetical protein